MVTIQVMSEGDPRELLGDTLHAVDWLDDTYPEMAGVLTEMHANGLGRSLVWGKPVVLELIKEERTPSEDDGDTLEAVAGDEDEDDDDPETAGLQITMAGYSLPLNREQTEHLLVWATGHMYKVAAPRGEAARRLYADNLAPNFAPYVTQGSSLPEAEAAFMNDLNCDRRRTVANWEARNQEVMHVAIEQAKQVSIELRAERKAAIAASVGELLSQFRPVFYPMHHNETVEHMKEFLERDHLSKGKEQA